MLTKILLFLIKVYQKTLSPDSGWFRIYYPYGFCRYYPTCSHYAYQSIKKKGALKGTIKAIWRLMRCHPLSSGGHDPVK